MSGTVVTQIARNKTVDSGNPSVPPSKRFTASSDLGGYHVVSEAVPAVDRLPFRDPALSTRKRIDDLLGRLTLDERIAMLHQYSPAVPRLGLAAFRTGTEALHGVAWLGLATVFPQAVGLGATWDEELVRRVAEATSVELRAFHYHRPTAVGTGTNSLQAWAPVLNLLRDPRWGRNEEGYSEDPVHTARLGTAFCRGLAGEHHRFLRAAPVLKHFLAYNNEDDRCTTSSGLRPRVLQEYDLAAFRPVVASGAATGAMAGYNLVNGRPCHVTPLIETELRRWAEPTGHELFVVSDAEAPSNLVDPEHYFDDHAESHGAALRAGIDSFTDHGEDSHVPVGRLCGGSWSSASASASSTRTSTRTPPSVPRSSTAPSTARSRCVPRPSRWCCCATKACCRSTRPRHRGSPSSARSPTRCARTGTAAPSRTGSPLPTG
jgi:beta-glucosidase